MENILEVSNLEKKYHTNKEEILALKDNSFSVKEGEYISIIRPK